MSDEEMFGLPLERARVALAEVNAAVARLVDAVRDERRRCDTEERDALAERAEKLKAALRSIAEGNLGGAPWQATYERLREFAHEALAGSGEGQK